MVDIVDMTEKVHEMFRSARGQRTRESAKRFQLPFPGTITNGLPLDIRSNLITNLNNSLACSAFGVASMLVTQEQIDHAGIDDYANGLTISDLPDTVDVYNDIHAGDIQEIASEDHSMDNGFNIAERHDPEALFSLYNWVFIKQAYPIYVEAREQALRVQGASKMRKSNAPWTPRAAAMFMGYIDEAGKYQEAAAREGEKLEDAYMQMAVIEASAEGVETEGMLDEMKEASLRLDNMRRKQIVDKMSEIEAMIKQTHTMRADIAWTEMPCVIQWKLYMNMYNSLRRQFVRSGVGQAKSRNPSNDHGNRLSYCLKAMKVIRDHALAAYHDPYFREQLENDIEQGGKLDVDKHFPNLGENTKPDVAKTPSKEDLMEQMAKMQAQLATLVAKGE